jgi:hypothetical protein
MAIELAKVGDVHIDGELDMSTKRAEAAVAAMDARISKVPVVKTVDVDLNKRAYDSKMTVLLARRDEKVLRVDADISAAVARIAELERKRNKTKIDVDAEIGKAQAKIRSLEALRDTVTIEFEVDSDKAEDALRRVDTELNRIRSNNQADINIEAGDASRAIALLGVLTAALGVVGQVAPAAAAAVAAVPTAIIAAAQGIGAVIAGLSGISDATQALQAVQDESATKSTEAADKQAAAANRVASANSALERALEQADRSAIQGAHQVTEAREAVADAQVTATRRVEDAEQSLAHAQVAAQDAQEALTRARKDAVENLEDLNRSVKGAALDEQAAVIALEKANERLQAARAANVGGRDMQEIALEAAQAAQALDEVRDRYGDLKNEATEANRAGVEGSNEVVSAQHQSEEATQRLQDAERDLTQARTDGARDVAKAQERVAEAQQQASWAAADASRQVADAQRALAEATKAVGDTGSAAMDKLLLAMAKLSPAGQRFATFLQNEVKPALRDIGGAAQTTMLPKVESAFEQLLTLAPMVEEAFADTGDVIGDLAVKGANLVTSGPWRQDFGTIVDRNNRILGMMGDAGLSALDAVRSLTIASGPLVESLAASAEASLDQFNAWIQGKRETGELQTWFAEMSGRIREFFSNVAALTGGVWNLLQALAPLGKVITDIVVPIVQFIGALAEANPALTSAVAIAVLAGSAFVSFFRTLGGLKQAVSTSVGVYQDMRKAVLGTSQATDQAGTAASRTAAATLAMGSATDRSSGLVGRLRGNLNDVRTSYTNASTAAKTWATATTNTVGTAASALTTKLLPATQRATQELDNMPAATGRVRNAFDTMASKAQTTMVNVSGAVAGSVAAVGRGVASAASGLVGALGGPFGIAIAAATIGLGFLVSAQADAAQAAAEHKAQIQTLTDALVESGGAIDDNVRKQVGLDLKQRDINDNAVKFGVNTSRMIDAITKGGTAASDFEKDLSGVADQLVSSNGLTDTQASSLRELQTELLKSGGSANSSRLLIEQLANSWQQNTGASDEAKNAFKAQLVQFADLVGGYKNAKNDFGTAAQDQQEIADAQDAATSATDRHTRALKALQDQVLGQIDKDLAYRQSLQSLAEAQDRVAHATGDDLPAALLNEEQALTDVIQKAGDLAYANSLATTEAGKQKDQVNAQAQAAVDLANKYGVNLPASLQAYVDKLGITRDATGQWVFQLDNVPATVLTSPEWEDTEARKKIVAYFDFINNKLSSLEYLQAVGLAVTPGNLRAVQQEQRNRAFGGVDIAAYANGGLRSMSANVAQMVAPNTPRLIGDRMAGDESFIPINGSPRSIAILAETARRMGFMLMPLFAGAILGMQNGGLNQAAGQAAGGGTAALSVDASPVDALTAAAGQLIAVGLVPLVDEINTAVAPALLTLEDLAGVQAVAAVTALADQLPPLQGSFAATATAIGASWWAITQASLTSVNSVGAYLVTLRQSIQQTGSVFGSTSDWIGTTWARIRQYTADPVRAALAGPYNAGLIPAWNYLNNFFALNRPLQPLAIPFAVGGQVPGVGSGDTVPALLTPGEYVLSKAVVKKWGLKNIDAAHMAARRGGFPGLEGMFTGDDQGIYRVGYASGGPVPEALARATQFGRSMDGKPYVWGGNSEAGTDCSGWMAMLARALVDERPYARREWATASTAGGNPPPRFARGIDGTFAIGVNPGVHTAGTMAGTNVESGGAHNYVAFGPPSTGADDGQFPLKFHLAELGGNFVSGGAGGAFNLAGFIRDSFNATYQQLAQYQNAWGANMMAQAGAALTTQAADAIVNYATSSISPMGTSGNVESWRPLVLQALRMLSLPAGWADITLRRMNQESGGNPNAVNLWDSNAKRGDPSKGLMQVIGSTFRAYRDTRAPDNVLDPLANVLSSMKYAMSRYGSLPAAYGRAGGYDSGGYLPPGYSTVYNGLSRPEVVLTDSQWNTMFSLAAQDSAGGDFRGNLYLSSGEFLGAVEGVIDRANTESGRVLSRRTR